jgi:hypothetical protein
MTSNRLCSTGSGSDGRSSDDCLVEQNFSKDDLSASKDSLIPSPATSTGKRGRERNKLMAAGLVPAHNVFSFDSETIRMQGYRLVVGADGHVQNRVELRCSDDLEAIKVTK